MNTDLKIIKKKYGEKFSKLCRDLFPSILETEGALVSIITSLFKENHYLYDDLVANDMVYKFQELVMNESNKQRLTFCETVKSPYELFKEKGYTLKECLTNEEILSYKKYYAEGEKLCTFNGNRLVTNRVFFAVKDDVEKIERKPFPKREDEYGTSVLSLQFTRANNYLSIKNRYNHTVNNPDATYQNNLENIAKGLTYSFEKYFGIRQSNTDLSFEIPNYVKTSEGKYYRYNVEWNNIYYCADNIVIDNFKEVSFPREKYVLFDGLVLDLVNKNIECYDEYRRDTFEDVCKDIKTIKIENNADSKNIYILCETGAKIYFELDKFNQIISVVMDGVERINDDFLENSFHIKRFSSKDTVVIEDRLLRDCSELEYLYLPKCEIIGDSFALRAENIKNVSLPNIKRVGYSFIAYAKNVETLYMPKLETVGNGFMFYNEKLQYINLPNVKRIGYSFMCENNSVLECNMPNLVIVGDSFLRHNKCLQKLNMPELQTVDKCFLINNNALTHIYMPNIENIGDSFLCSNEVIRNVYIPNVKFIGSNFLSKSSDIINNLYMPSLVSIGINFSSSRK